MDFTLLLGACLIVIALVVLVLLAIVCIDSYRLEKIRERNTIPCPKCGSKKIMCCIMASEGYQYSECLKCGHKFQDKGDSAVTVSWCNEDEGCESYELEKPEVDEDGTVKGDNDEREGK